MATEPTKWLVDFKENGIYASYTLSVLSRVFVDTSQESSNTTAVAEETKTLNRSRKKWR